MSLQASPNRRPEIAERLLAWYDRHARVLPWRVPPGAPTGVRADPYRVWLSEIMLQQTTVASAIPYFEAFTRRWPHVQALAAAPLEDVLAAWAGLGYYARARNLHACAGVVVRDHSGRFPSQEAALRRLPGIGPYTSAAIAAIAFGEAASVVDGNVERVTARLFALRTPLPKAKSELRALAGGLLPPDPAPDFRYGDFAQSMMDLGATVCVPRRPSCALCPLKEDCAGQAAGLAGDLPRQTPKKARPTRRGAAFWLTRPDGRVLLRRRTEKGLLGGMMEVPSAGWQAAHPGGDGGDPALDLAPAPVPAAWVPLPGVVRHTFTHFYLELVVWAAEVRPRSSGRRSSGEKWVKFEELSGVGLPSLMDKVARHALKYQGDSPCKRGT